LIGTDIANLLQFAMLNQVTPILESADESDSTGSKLLTRYVEPLTLRATASWHAQCNAPCRGDVNAEAAA
jgi:hypothetical protein